VEIIGKIWQRGSPDDHKESWMNSPDIAEAALARAWSVYLLIHSDINDNDARRASLQRFIRQRCEAGETDTELLAVQGLKFLKSLKGFADDWSHRPAASLVIHYREKEERGAAAPVFRCIDGTDGGPTGMKTMKVLLQ
jgi:hypothetical protein